MLQKCLKNPIFKKEVVKMEKNNGKDLSHLAFVEKT